uniref:Uncharacterized protein n=1 Tax=Arundo donax TaxID=35708 RepID=A0A0A9E7F3_ARUDO
MSCEWWICGTSLRNSCQWYRHWRCASSTGRSASMISE